MAHLKVRVSCDHPQSKAGWDVDICSMGETPEQQLAYVNLAYALVAKAMSKLGVAMSQSLAGDNAQMDAMKRELEG